jgi:hypothetical protein
MYNFVYARLNDVATAKAEDVCPDGKEGVPAANFLKISG